MSEPNQPGTVVRTSVLAIWSLVLGVLSLMCFGMLTGVPAIICGHVAQYRIKQSGGSLGGSGLSIGGLVTGYIGTLLTTLAFLGVMAAIAVPAFVSARDTARRTHCMSNLSQIGKICIMYASEYDNRYPADLKTVATYGGASTQLFVCPSSGSRPEGLSSVDVWSDYVLVPGRTGFDSPDAVLAFCKSTCHRAYGGSILSVDGAVQWYDRMGYDRRTAPFRSDAPAP
jgi:hypothetical protein